MDNAYHLDVGEILRTLRSADVVVLRFVTVPQRLLIDNRTNDVDGPLLKLVPRAANAEDRFKSLKQLRPRFKLPQKITAVFWPRYIHSLQDHGVWQAIVQRVVDAGYAAVAAEAEAIFEELRAMERAEMYNAIAGEGYRTLWPAGRQR
jgi:hypothetical protein